MSRRAVAVIALLGLVGLAYYLTVGRDRQVCTACLRYRARASCATASGGTAAAAVDKALRRACNAIAPADSVAACVLTPPASIQCESD